MEPYDERGANEAGYPWQRDYSSINPAYLGMHLTHVVLIFSWFSK